MKNILIASNEYTESINNIIPTKPISALPPSMSRHADLQAHFLSENELLVCPECYDYYKKLLPDINVIKGFSSLGSTYQEHSAYNIARVSGYAFHNTKYTDPVAKEYFASHGIPLVHVNQGYTKCSTAVISKNAVITQDTGIYNAVKEIGASALLCQTGFIELSGYDYGFIGGVCGLISEKTIFFTGKIRSHPDGEEIYNFIKKQGVEVFEGDIDSLYDIGSILQNIVF